MSFVLLLLFVVISTLCMTHAIRTLRVSPHVIRRTDAKSSTAVDLSNSSYNQTTQSGDIEVVADGVVNAHVVMVSFGDSPRPARLLIDTGSPDTLVMVANVDLARLQESSITPTSFADFLPFIGPILFDLRLSATGRNLSYDNVAAMNAHWCANEQLKFEMGSNPCTIGEIYGDGSLRIGVVERDLVDLGARADMVFLRALRVGSGHLSAKTDNAIEGILGLSPSDGIGHLPATLDQLSDAHDIKHRLFGLCLPDPASPFDAFETAPDGDLIIGAPHDLSMVQLAANREFSVALHTNTTWYADNGTFVPRYLVQVNGALVGSTAVAMSVLALVDSGSVRTILPAPVFDAIADAYVAACATWSRRNMLCPAFGQSRIRKLFGEKTLLGWSQYALGGLTEDDLAQFPPIQFELDNGNKVEIDWRHLFMRQDDLIALTVSRGTPAMPMTVLGNNMMRAYRTVFDVDSQTITFATPNVCSYRVNRPLPAWMIIVGTTVGGVVVILVCVVVVCLCRRRRRVREESLLDSAARDVAPDDAPAVEPESTADDVPPPFVRV
jgi:hypothetical protein